MTVPDDHPHKYKKGDENHPKATFRSMGIIDKINEGVPEWDGTFTPEEAQRIPFGVMESVVNQKANELSKVIQQKEQEIEYLRLQLAVLSSVVDESDKLKYQYARGKKQ